MFHDYINIGRRKILCQDTNLKRFSQEYPGMAIKPDFSRFKAMKLRYHIVDAFTDHPFGGNPAGVVLLDGDVFPPEKLMLQIAAELLI
jgi:hypothetical protein